MNKRVRLTENVSSILLDHIPPNLKDFDVATNSCLIGDYTIDRALLDLGASMNLLSYSVYQQIGLGELKPTPVTLIFAERFVKVSQGVVEDILVKVDTTIVLDISFDNMKLRLKFFSSSQHPSYDVQCVDIDMIYECVEEISPLMLLRDPLETMFLLDRPSILGLEDPYEHISAICDSVSNLEKRPWKAKFETLPTLYSIPAHPSIEAPPSLELKPLLASIKYVFLYPHKTLPVIISSSLTSS
ncbi:uncharacterized protein LOC131162312 [Malania oleifera]|uniref:uncharacterized protein LOC131162312 n=1 Tax=Malania oleifera TaxID=397392 RepID=UPI0025ADA364|nr:uncharacterized protein LOC131162312 [Malania oleifera]